MARPLRLYYPGAFYHITARGNERKNIFNSDRDRLQFLSYLESAHQRHGALFHGYCLMENHYHLLLETPRENLSRIMHHINIIDLITCGYIFYKNMSHQFLQSL